MPKVVDIIGRKRDGEVLSHEEIAWFIDGLTNGGVADYQAAAWLMAVVLRGMNPRETADLTAAMAASGEQLDLGRFGSRAVDKHSTGGVGDKTTLVVGPIVAACGLAVGKMSGRGLGFTGGTIDKLESISGFTAEIGQSRFLTQLEQVGLVIAGQSANLAPADGHLYALRDVTGTVESLPLIASSIMSKKIAAGCPAICLDVKVGRGAFMKTEDSARELAHCMVDIGNQLGRRMTAVISGMDEPLGYAVGNALEVAEAVHALQGNGPTDLMLLAVALSVEMLLLGGLETDVLAARERIYKVLDSGAALNKFIEMVAAQGGDVEQIRDVEKLPHTDLVAELPSPRTGYVTGIDPLVIAQAAAELGAGRTQKGDAIDPAVGIVMQIKIGDLVRSGESLLVLHCRSREQLAPLGDRLLEAFQWSELPARRTPLIREIIHSSTPAK